MIAKWIALSARYRGFTVLAVLAITCWGFFAMTKIPLDAVPDLSDTQVIVFTEWMGRSPVWTIFLICASVMSQKSSFFRAV